MTSAGQAADLKAAGFESVGPLDLLIIQGTPFCNIDCDYCYLPDRHITKRMPPETLRRLFERVAEGGFAKNEFTIVWHAGEPLVLPVAFYRDADRLVHEVNPPEVEIRHSFQTNGTLINDDWCELFKERQCRVGVSVDGPAFLHDRHRKTRAGTGTFEKVRAGMCRLVQHGIPYHVISVLTSDSLDFPDELFEFYLEHQVSLVGFNIEEIEGPHKHSSLQNHGSEDRFRKFIDRFFDLMVFHEKPFEVREFSGAMGAMMAPAPDLAGCSSHQTSPYGIISVDCDGNFSTFSPELLGLPSAEYGDFVLGNVHRDSFIDALIRPKAARMAEDIRAGIRACKDSCGYFDCCGGGAPSNKYFEHGTFRSTQTMFCRYTKQLIVDVLLEKLGA